MNKKITFQSGFSLIEVLVVVTIVMVISAVAVLTFSGSKTDLERQRIVREFKIYLERARFDSVKRRAYEVNDMARITLNSASSFTAAFDMNGNGTLDTSDVRNVDFTQRSNTQIVVMGTQNYPITILFNHRGHIIAKDNLGNTINPVFNICSKNCLATTQNNEDLTVISVSKTGTVAVMGGGQSPTALPTPSLTNSSPLLNCYVLLSNTSGSGCINN